jgi:hypothetical protein
LKSVDAEGQFTYSNVLRVNRDDVTNTKVVFNNRITGMLDVRIIDMQANSLSIKIIDNSGREIRSQKVKINPGENYFNINTSSIPTGYYFMILSGDNYKRTFSFVKS